MVSFFFCADASRANHRKLVQCMSGPVRGNGLGEAKSSHVTESYSNALVPLILPQEPPPDHDSHGRTTMPSRSWRCSLPSCRGLTFDSKDDVTRHQRQHFAEMSGQFTVSSVCPWPDCRSQKSLVAFKSVTKFNKHLRNHFKSHWCTRPECTHDKPFGTPHDLNRHISSKHLSQDSFCCLIGTCSQSFSRKDKLVEHGRKDHGSFKCNLDHCEQVINTESRDRHFKVFHSSVPKFECALPGCESSVSLFNNETATRHVEIHHGAGQWAASYLMKNIRRCRRWQKTNNSADSGIIKMRVPIYMENFGNNLSLCEYCRLRHTSSDTHNGNDK